MGVVTGEGGQKGITGAEGQGEGSARREEQNEEWMQAKTEELTWVCHCSLYFC